MPLKKGFIPTKKQKEARKLVGIKNTKHGLWGTKIYYLYYGAKQRCINPKQPMYPVYGGRGIKFMWNSFLEFYNDMKDMYNEIKEEIGEADISIDRIDVNGNYCKENCQFIHKKCQSGNQQRHHTKQYLGWKKYAEENLIDIHNKKEYHIYWTKYIKK